MAKEAWSWRGIGARTPCAACNDIDAGRILEGKATLDEVAREIRDLTLALGKGERTRSEELGHQEFILTYERPFGTGHSLNRGRASQCWLTIRPSGPTGTVRKGSAARPSQSYSSFLRVERSPPPSRGVRGVIPVTTLAKGGLLEGLRSRDGY
jgi:hypothetical protein